MGVRWEASGSLFHGQAPAPLHFAGDLPIEFRNSISEASDGLFSGRIEIRNIVLGLHCLNASDQFPELGPLLYKVCQVMMQIIPVGQCRVLMKQSYIHLPAIACIAASGYA